MTSQPFYFGAHLVVASISMHIFSMEVTILTLVHRGSDIWEGKDVCVVRMAYVEVNVQNSRNSRNGPKPNLTRFRLGFRLRV
jgi:hypothetical protein